MNRKKFYIITIALLFISNLATLFFIMQKGKQKYPVENTKEIIIKKLGFNEQQIVTYEKLIEQHKENIFANDKKIFQLKKELYSLLLTNANEQQTDSLTTEIIKVQKEIETVHFNHFKDIKTICKPEQAQKFEALAWELNTLFSKNIHSKKSN